MNKRLDEARRECVLLLRRYLRASEAEKTPILRAIAETLVTARGEHEREDGSPDWKGRSYPYRVLVRDVFAEARVPKDAQATIQAAVRYHVGTVLRERLDEDTLAEYDLIPHSPRERSADRRASRSALLSALTSKDLAGGSLVAISAAQAVLSKVQAEDLDGLSGDAAAVAEAALAQVERRAKALRRRLNAGK